MIAIVILAAGASSRMRGTDKLVEDVNGEPLLRLQTKRALATGAQVFVALPLGALDRAVLIAGLDATILWIADADVGMGATLREAVAQLPQVTAFMVVLADLVALTTHDLNAVISSRDTSPNAQIWRGATEDEKPGHPVLFDASLRPLFMTLDADDGAQAIIDSRLSQTCLVPLAGQRARYDLDTPEDWAAFRKTTS